MQLLVMTAIASILISACSTPAPPSTDAGADPDINDCCWCLVKPTCAVQRCFDDTVRDIDNGAACHWLTCGVWPFREVYHAGACR